MRLTRQQWLEIYDARRAGTRVKELAAKYGVSTCAVYQGLARVRQAQEELSVPFSEVSAVIGRAWGVMAPEQRRNTLHNALATIEAAR